MFVLGSYNNTPVNIHFLVVQVEWSLASVMALMLFSGFIFGLIAALIIGSGNHKGAKASLPPDDATEQATTNTTPVLQGKS